MTNRITTAQPYLYLDGRCEEALEYYRKVLEAEIVALARFKESPDPTMMCPTASPDKIMHGSFRVGNSIILVSDGRCEGRAAFEGFSLSLTVRSAAEAEELFAALSEGGQVQMPLMETFFSPRFGMVADRFGVPWMIYVEPAGEQSAKR